MLYTLKNNLINPLVLATADEMDNGCVLFELNHDCRFHTEKDALARHAMVRNKLGHIIPLVPSKHWPLDVRVKDNAIEVFWSGKWRAIREYRVKNTRPSADVMKQVERTFRINSGMPDNNSIEWLWV